MFRLPPDWQSVFYGREDYTPFHQRTGRSQEALNRPDHDEIHLTDNPVQHTPSSPQNQSLEKHRRSCGSLEKISLQSGATEHLSRPIVAGYCAGNRVFLGEAFFRLFWERSRNPIYPKI